MRPCFSFSAKTPQRAAVLALDDEIGFWGTQAADFRNQLNQVDGDLEVEINSPGGDVMAGLGMYNMLRNHAAKGHKVVTRVTGVAASIASIIVLAADRREMPSNAWAMTHAVSSGAWGTADELRAQADVVDKIQASLRNIYVDRMGITAEKADEIMSQDTWLSAQECLELGFVTDVVDPVTATAKFDMSRAELPEHVASVFAAKQESDLAPADSVDQEDPGAAVENTIEVPDTPLAEAIVAEAKKMGLEAHAPHFALQFNALVDARTRMFEAREITALCNVVGRAEHASKLIREGKSVMEARAELTNLLAECAEHIDNAPRIENGLTSAPAAKPAVNTESIWASHNAQRKKEGR